MATKAELEMELAALRQQLAERPELVAAPESEAMATEAKEEAAEPPNLEKDIADLLAEFDDVPHKKTILLALGVFALGYLIGRSR